MKKPTPPKSTNPGLGKKKSKAPRGDPDPEKRQEPESELVGHKSELKKKSKIAPKESALKKPKTIGDDPVLKKMFKDARRKVPKYLFRVWSSVSGGNKLLNSTERVTPHAFHNSKGHESMFDLTRHKLQRTTMEHLHESAVEDTEFSSWAASPQFVLRYAMTHQKHDAHIAIIDTEELSNSIFHVPFLDGIFNPYGPPAYSGYHEEYLVHGLVEGDAYKAVSLRSLLSAGLATQFSMFNTGPKHSAWHGLGQISPTFSPVTEDEARAMRNIGQLYGQKFYVAFTISLICLKRRSYSLWENIGTEEVSMILKVLHRKNFPDLSGSPGIVGSSLYDPRYEDNSQMFQLMRALQNQCYGKGARLKAAQVFAKGEEQSAIFPDIGSLSLS